MQNSSGTPSEAAHAKYTTQEDMLILEAARRFKNKTIDWEAVSKHVKTRSAASCKGRFIMKLDPARQTEITAKNRLLILKDFETKGLRFSEYAVQDVVQQTIRTFLYHHIANQHSNILLYEKFMVVSQEGVVTLKRWIESLSQHLGTKQIYRRIIKNNVKGLANWFGIAQKKKDETFKIEGKVWYNELVEHGRNGKIHAMDSNQKTYLETLIQKYKDLPRDETM